MSIDQNSSYREALSKYGLYLGLIFQITDDLLDLEGKQNLVGKPVGTDLKENNITLPLIYAMNNSNAHENKEIIKKIKKGVNKSDIKAIIRFCVENKGIERARQKACFYADKAREQIQDLPLKSTNENALYFIDYVLNRKR